MPSGMVYQIATGRDGSERRFLYVSQSHETLTGIPAEAVLADPGIPYGLILPEHRPAMVEAEAGAIRERRPFDVQVQFRRADGELRWSRIISAPREMPDGSQIWDGIQIDITDQKSAEALLRELNDTLEDRVVRRTAERDQAWRLSQDLLVVAEQDGTLAAVNAAWTDLLGWRPEELVGVRFGEFVHPDDLDATLAAFAGVFEAPLTVPFEYRFRHRDGGWRWFAWTAAYEDGRVYASGRDVTERKAQAAALAQAEEQLRQSQKMEAVGQLTGGIAHDFNNMLAAVVGSLDLLGRRIGPEDARARRYADAAMEGARRAALLTQRLLAFSRQQPLRPEPVAVNALVAGMSELIRGSIGGDVRLETVLASGLWRAHADPNQLENAILNLAVNARDAMPEGGRLTIETQNAHIDERYAAANLGVPAGQYVLIAVTDTGAGMPAEVIAKAFDPFFTTKPVGKGTGLGLSQVYGFVKQSGGHVKIYSEPGEGTTVKVYLPRLVGADADAPVEGPAAALPLGEGQEVILVVEDEPAVRQVSVDALTELGYRVIEADGAAAALRLLDGHPEIALLFTDVVMPDTNGRKLADEARRRRPDLRVLFTTGYTRNAVVHNGVLDPGVDLIGKPFTIEELAAKVRAILDRPPDDPAAPT
jgi:PAS domain S-box-containing protein